MCKYTLFDYGSCFFWTKNCKTCYFEELTGKEERAWKDLEHGICRYINCVFIKDNSVEVFVNKNFNEETFFAEVVRKIKEVCDESKSILFEVNYENEEKFSSYLKNLGWREIQTKTISNTTVSQILLEKN
jgi:hypothetical protein